MNKIKTIINNNFTLNFIVSNKCNYSCAYCPSDLNDGSTPHVSSDEYIQFFHNLLIDNPEISEYTRRIVTFTGGEPSIYEGITSLMTFFKENNFENLFISNGSAKMNFWNDHIDLIDNLVLSFHPRYGNYKHFAEIIELFKSKNKSLSVHALMDYNYWDRAIEASQFFKEKNIPVNYKGLLIKRNRAKNGFYHEEYTEEQLEFLRNNHTENEDENNVDTVVNYTDGTSEKFNAQKIISGNLNNFYQYKCGTGRTSLVIKQDGDICGSTCKYTYFGNIVQDRNLRVKLNTTDILCPRDNKCPCIYDLKIPKELINEY
jgi:organic radical activating enzyme